MSIIIFNFLQKIRALFCSQKTARFVHYLFKNPAAIFKSSGVVILMFS